MGCAYEYAMPCSGQPLPRLAIRELLQCYLVFILQLYSGFEIARQLGQHGASIVVMGRRADVLAAAVAQLQREGIAAQGTAGAFCILTSRSHSFTTRIMYLTIDNR